MGALSVLLMLPAIWALIAGAALVEMAAALVNSAAFPLLIASFLASVAALGAGGVTAWKKIRGVDVPVKRAVAIVGVLLLLAFALFCAALWFGANTLLSLIS